VEKTNTYFPGLCARIACSVLLVVVAQAAGAATVRGRLIHAGNSYPAAGLAVTVYNQGLGRSSPAYSGADGMYYLYNIPPGYYYLEVWIGAQPMVYQVQVIEPYVDIPQIIVP
jgi:hypothetical protein